jgi:hypothetical protein
MSRQEGGGASREDQLTAAFAQLVLQQSNLAMMLLGRTPHPQSGETVRDLEAARMFIDQLEMIETKTKGNLNRDEQALLQQSLMQLRLAFVEAVETPRPSQPEAAPAAPSQPPPAGTEPAPGTPAPDAESKKKFTKRY